MTEKRVFRSDTFVNRSFVAGIPFILMFGGLTHFAFAWLGKTNWAAPFVPVNESVWEHLKMSYWTTFLWFFFIFLFFGKRYRLSSSRWLLAGIVSMLFCPHHQRSTACFPDLSICRTSPHSDRNGSRALAYSRACFCAVQFPASRPAALSGYSDRKLWVLDCLRR